MQWRFWDNPKILVPPPLTPDWAYVVGRKKPLGYSISLRTISLREFNNNDDEHIHVIEIFVVHFFFVFRFVDESPRWLFSQGRYQECDAIIRKMLIQNGKADAIPEQGFTIDQLQRALSTTTSDMGRQEPLEQATTNVTPVVVQEGGKEVTTVAVISSSDRKYGIVDLFKTPRLRSRTLNISLNW